MLTTWGFANWEAAMILFALAQALITVDLLQKEGSF